MKRPPSGILRTDFFKRPAAAVARDLLGKALVRQRGNGRLSAIITETEAYEGVHDLASHSARGLTPRTAVMFGPPGRFYVYRIYGLHWMLNIVTGEIDEAAAVLIRAWIWSTVPRASRPRSASMDHSMGGKRPCQRAFGSRMEDMRWRQRACCAPRASA